MPLSVRRSRPSDTGSIDPACNVVPYAVPKPRSELRCEVLGPGEPGASMVSGRRIEQVVLS